MKMKPGTGLNLKEIDLPYTRSKLGQHGVDGVLTVR
jgi:hypothetical protein